LVVYLLGLGLGHHAEAQEGEYKEVFHDFSFQLFFSVMLSVQIQSA
jgi:hypothetical protein